MDNSRRLATPLPGNTLAWGSTTQKVPACRHREVGRRAIMRTHVPYAFGPNIQMTGPNDHLCFSLHYSYGRISGMWKTATFFHHPPCRHRMLEVKSVRASPCRSRRILVSLRTCMMAKTDSGPVNLDSDPNVQLGFDPVVGLDVIRGILPGFVNACRSTELIVLDTVVAGDFGAPRGRAPLLCRNERMSAHKSVDHIDQLRHPTRRGEAAEMGNLSCVSTRVKSRATSQTL
jgi:hypothetical protein